MMPDVKGVPLSVWSIRILSSAAVSAAILPLSIPRARKEGDCVLSAHGLILLLGLVLASLGVIALKFSSV